MRAETDSSNVSVRLYFSLPSLVIFTANKKLGDSRRRVRSRGFQSATFSPLLYAPLAFSDERKYALR